MSRLIHFLHSVRSNNSPRASTGEPDGHPCKVGVAATDVATGLYAHGAILSGLLSVQRTGKGVWIDCNLMETQVSINKSLELNGFSFYPCLQIAGLANIGSNFLIAGKEGSRHGTAHPSIVPYQVCELFERSDLPCVMFSTGFSLPRWIRYGRCWQ